MGLREEDLYEIFLDINKSYDALDCDFCLDILEAYGVVPRSLCLLRHYWDILMMVAWSRGYFVTPYKGYRGVTQGDPLSPTIFNVLVDAVFRHWVAVVTSMEESVDPGAADMEGFGWDVQHIVAYLYADDGLLNLTWVARLQCAFKTLTEIFVRVGLYKNIAKTVIMDYPPCRALGGHSAEAYCIRMMGEGHTYRE